MICPYCDGKTKVVDSRETGWRTRRKRVCLSCGHDFYTIEILRDMNEPRRKHKKKGKRPCLQCYYSNLCTEEDMLLGEEEKFRCFIRGEKK